MSRFIPFAFAICFYACVGMAAIQKGVSDPYVAPELGKEAAWINSPPLNMKDLRGKVVLVDFWAYSCINCIRTLSYMTAWDEKYRDKGLVIIGVHAPEFDFEKKQENVQRAVTKYGIKYPVALDNDLETWRNFNNQYWPAHYLIDRSGNVAYTHFGEGNYDVTENNIRMLLGEKEKTVTENKPAPFIAGQTPETYLGYARMENMSERQSVDANQSAIYDSPPSLPQDFWGLRGLWKVESQKIIASGNDAVLRLHFKARKVFVVLGTHTGKPVHATLTLNEKPPAENAGKDATKGLLNVDHSALYEIINQKDFKDGEIDIYAEPGLEAYSFTFGS